jgi:hypothetical protein
MSRLWRCALPMLRAVLALWAMALLSAAIPLARSAAVPPATGSDRSEVLISDESGVGNVITNKNEQTPRARSVSAGSVQATAPDSSNEPAQTWLLDEYAAEGLEPHPIDEPTDFESHEPFDFHPHPGWLGLRHSSTHGRNAGLGIPLTGTSWLNRPYYLGVDSGAVWITEQINDDISTDSDPFIGIFGGCEWDHYWATELAIHRATPELLNEEEPDANRGDRMMIYSASLLYYPWGDSFFRPYWRCGLGATDIDYPLQSGERRDESLWTFPLGFGIKYPMRPWLAARTELADQLAVGNNGVSAQHNVTFTIGFEWRFGAHPRSYWPWNPSRHVW